MAAGTKVHSSLGLRVTMAMQMTPMNRPIALENSPADSVPITSTAAATARTGRYRGSASTGRLTIARLMIARSAVAAGRPSVELPRAANASVFPNGA